MLGTSKRRVATTGGELAVVDVGDPEAPPVVLLHGFATSSWLWRSLVPLLAPFTRVIAPDLLGAGDSEKPAVADYRIAADRDRVIEVLDALGVERSAVVGHAHGGAVAQLLAIDGRVDALGLVDTVAFGAALDRLRELRRELDAAGPALVEAWIREAFDRGMTQRVRLHDADLEGFVRPYRNDAAAGAFVEAAVALDAHSGLEATEAALAQLRSEERRVGKEGRSRWSPYH